MEVESKKTKITNFKNPADVKSSFFKLRITADEKDQLASLARTHNVTMGELIRQSIGKAKSWAPKQTSLSADDLRLIQVAITRTKAVDRVGVNVNQIARSLHAHASNIDNDLLNNLLEELFRIREELAEIKDAQ